MESGDGDGAVGRELGDGLMGSDASVCDASAPVSGVEEAAYFFVVLGLGAEDGVDLVEEDSGSSFASD